MSNTASTLATAPTTSTKSTCPYCGVGCGIVAARDADGAVSIKGDPEHPANQGRLCSKGSALAETLSLDERLLHPMVDGKRASWETALDTIAETFARTIAEHGAESVAFYVSGQLLTEDYYVANKLMKGFIGSANIDTNSRLCMASSVAGHRRAFGSDTVPGCYEDIDEADLVVLVGSNLAWCHPVLYQRLEAAKDSRGTKVVVIDPRRTATCEIADLHLAIEPGSDVALFNGLLTTIAGANATKQPYIAKHTAGFKDALASAMAMPISKVARTTGIPHVLLQEFYDLFVSTEKVVTIYSQGVNQASTGTDKVNAIINCHLATGRIGKAGMGPFSVTGQPNAMGGREVGGLANMLAAHMEIADPEHRRIVQEFWRSPGIADKPGLKAVDMFRAVGDGRIKAIWIMATNPVDSMPEADVVRAALDQCPFVVVSDVVSETDTTAHAHVLLPSAAWGEKSGTVTNSERRISRQRSFLDAPGDARPDWWQLAEVAKRMGFADQFGWASPGEIFSEHARLTAVENAGRRDLDLANLATLSASDYDALEPIQWPKRQARMFAEGRFFTTDGRARFVPTPYRGLALAPSKTFPLVLNTGRVRDQWHTMTRTAKSARLMRHNAEPFLEVHPDDADRHGLAPAALAAVESALGRAVLRVVVTDRQRPGTVFAPIHWTDQVASNGRIDALIAGCVDPVSGQPELKAMPVAIRPFAAAWYGFAITRDRPTQNGLDYWAIARALDGWRLEMAGMTPPADWSEFASGILAGAPDAHWLSYHDEATGSHRFAAFDGAQLVGALFIGSSPVAVSRSWAEGALSDLYPEARSRHSLLAGHAGAGQKDKGAIVCACFDVGRNEINESVRAGCLGVADVGRALKAGTNCGSCRSEIGRLIDAARIPQAV